MSCVSCGSCEIEYVDAKGETVCMACGTILEESSIVNAIGFDENAAGARHVGVRLFAATRDRVPN